MKDKQGKHSSKRIGMMIISIIGVLVILVGVSYAWFVLTVHGTKTQVIKTGNLELTLDETASEGISLDQAMPLTDTEGLKTTSYKFTLKNTGTLDAHYDLKLEDLAITGTRMPDNVVKYWLKKGATVKSPSLLSTSDRVLDSGILQAKGSIQYELKLWIDYDAGNEIQGTKFNANIVVTGNLLVPTDEKCFTFRDGAIKGYSDTCPKDVVIPKTINGSAVTTIGDGAFYNKQLTSVVIPSSVTSIGVGAFSYNSLSDEDAFIYKRNSDGSIDDTTLVGYGGEKQENIVVPTNVKNIEDNAFYGCYVESITLPEGLLTIGHRAFIENGLTTITIPSTVTSIEIQAFFHNKLTSVTILEGVTSIGAGAFWNNKLTSVTIPSSVTSIEDDAFDYNQLTSVIIKGKSSSTGFTGGYGTNIWGWEDGYSDANITWEP